MHLTVQEIKTVLEGELLTEGLVENPIITSICTDSRKLTEGCLFIPLVGERFDGHDFIEQAANQKASMVLTQDKTKKSDKLKTLYVKDTKVALATLATYYLSLFKIPVVAVTGSVGKTSTKDLIAAVLQGKYNVHKTQGNFNNEIGLPLTIFELDETKEIVVLEMGMNHFGEIHNLSMIAKPSVSVITNIGMSHIENLGSQEGILKAKLEILEGMQSGGKLFVNGDDTLLRKVENKKIEVKTYGLNAYNPYWADQIQKQDDAITACYHTPKDTYQLTIQSPGEHMVYNLCAAIAIAEYFEVSKEEIEKGLSLYKPTKMRMNISTYENGITVIDDTYNASPDSMRAALKVLQDYQSSGKKIAVLGDMLELGEYAKSLHEKVGEYVNATNIDELCVVGKWSAYIAERVEKENGSIQVERFDSKEEWIEKYAKTLRTGDVVLFKASRGMQFEKMVEAVGKVK